MSPLFAAGSLTAFEMDAGDLPSLQRFFEENPEYHLAVEGEPPGADAAQKEFDAVPPADWPFEKKWLIGVNDADGRMIGMADLIENLFVDGVWHIGLFIVAAHLHGRGTAPGLYRALEAWLREQDCRWIRLGVVEGNARAERFWEKVGYHEVRKRRAIPMGRRTNDVRVMVKPLAGGSLREYLSAVARDRPE
ncbi:MAG TPA: GNAT family N-acetyltransferase [Burkholderiales bacterium]|nr:GNAT family N-acetyltransferase [Burkholderiales bacterium]